MMAERRVRIVVSGKVQGVWFRAWTEKEARARGVDGWVRNRTDGTVEAVLAGPADAVEAMIALCHQGPPHAAVTDVAVVDAPDADAPHPFETRSTL